MASPQPLLSAQLLFLMTHLPGAAVEEAAAIEVEEGFTEEALTTGAVPFMPVATAAVHTWPAQASTGALLIVAVLTEVSADTALRR